MDAPNLHTFCVDLPTNGNLLRLPRHKHRTQLVLQAHTPTNQASDTRIWVGQLPPTIDTDKWPRLEDENGVHFPNGVQGPIYMVDPSRETTTIAVVSSVVEEPHEFLLIQAVAKRDLLVTEAGDIITTESGDPLYVHL